MDRLGTHGHWTDWHSSENVESDPGTSLFGSHPQSTDEPFGTGLNERESLEDAFPNDISLDDIFHCDSLGPGIHWEDHDSFLPQGAWRPPEPCTYCRRMRLQCFSLQTTDANPNPVTSCSSCVALFRQCSLAERHKRQPHHYETNRPVIDQLHGIKEHDFLTGSTDGLDFGESEEFSVDTTRPEPSGASSNTSERAGSHSRSVKRTRPLREWLACNIGNPYPTKADKADLERQTGLTKMQINNWFLNARRRQRHSEKVVAQRKILPQGSPMPSTSPLSMMTPLDRWRCSPPEDEPITISPAALEPALNDSFYTHSRPASGSGYASSPMSGDSWLHSQPQSLYTSSNPDSTNAFCHSNDSNSIGSLCTSYDAFTLPPTSTRASTGPSNSSFQCTFCLRTFKKRFDWRRHELSVHMPSLNSWVCAVPLAPDESFLIWRTGQDSPECVFCGHASPTDDHFQSHEFDYCSQGSGSGRVFSRKDHLWQHLYKFHGCRKWSGWTPDLASLKKNSDAINSRCGFCDVAMVSWKEREQHMADHFLDGVTMASWTGENGGVEQVT